MSCCCVDLHICYSPQASRWHQPSPVRSRHRVQGPGDGAFMVYFTTELLQGQHVLLILNGFLLFSLSTSPESFLFDQHNVCQVCPRSEFQHFLSKPGMEDTFISCAIFSGLRCCLENTSHRYTGKEYHARLMVPTVDVREGQHVSYEGNGPWARCFNHFLSFSPPFASCLCKHTSLRSGAFALPSDTFCVPLLFA